MAGAICQHFHARWQRAVRPCPTFNRIEGVRQAAEANLQQETFGLCRVESTPLNPPSTPPSFSAKPVPAPA